MKLYFIPQACSLAVHIVLLELDLKFELVRVNSKSKNTSEGENFLRVNPKGYVAALQLDNGEILTEACVILEYLASLHPEAALAPADGSWERTRLREWLNFISSELQARYDTFFLDGMPVAAKDIFKGKIYKRFDHIEAALQERDYLHGKTCTIADIYLFTIVSWSPWFDMDLSPWPRMRRLLQEIAERPAVKTAIATELKTEVVN